MSDMFVVDGAPGTPGQLASYESYFASFSEPAQWPAGSQSRLSSIHTPLTWTGRNHRLRPDSGTGTIGVLENAGDLRIVRYDAAFDRPHALGYSFPSERFELEICLDGRMEILENQAGRGELVSGEVSVSPSRRTAGSVTFPAQERYRAISVSGSYDAFAAFLGSVGVTRFRQVMTHRSSSRGSRDYLGAPVTHPGALETGNLLYEEVGALLDAPGQVGSGELLTMECRIMAMLAGLLTDSESAIPGAAISDNSRHDVVIEQFERDRVQEVTQLLWERRHDLPTLREIARQVHMSPKRLSAVHRAVYGTTVMERHRRRCVDRACHLLTATEWTVEHIGHHCGYATSSNFIYAFRLRLGCTPGEYRHEQRVH